MAAARVRLRKTASREPQALQHLGARSTCVGAHGGRPATPHRPRVASRRAASTALPRALRVRERHSSGLRPQYKPPCATAVDKEKAPSSGAFSRVVHERQ